MGEPSIELKNISYGYGKTKVIKDLTLNIERNETTCILGSSGSGKTTLLRIISGLEIIRDGAVYINGKKVAENGKNIVSPDNRKVGFIFQDLALWPHFTVFKNIAFGLKVKKENDIERRVNDIAEMFGLAAQLKKYPSQLSGGQKQLVAIARSLVLKPEILLLDEPLASLDVKIKRNILEYIAQLKNSFNLTVVYVTHDHKEAFSIADKVVVINDGRVEDSGTVEQIKNSNNQYVKFFLEY